jgi:aerobic carbon-monoxide dehydrogenase large subunit
MTKTVQLEKERAREEPLRTEDFRLMTGRGRFVDDIKIENQAYIGLVHSPHAHAKIKSIDFSMARKSPDFIMCLTGEDLLKEKVEPVTQNQWPRQRPAKRYHLAVGEVRFVGEPVAAILAKDRASAEDLAELVSVEYEELPVVTNLEQAKRGKILVYSDWKDNLSQNAEKKKGDADKTISSAAFVIKASVGIRRQDAIPIEPHSVVVSYDKESGVFDVLATVQTVHGLQETLSTELNIPKKKFHVRVMDMGGGFGTKGGASYPWAPLACLFAKKTGLTVKWTGSRTEEFLELASGRDEYCDITLACDKDGRIVALKARIECDIGVSGTQVHMPSLTMETMTGPYKIPNLDLKVQSYVTNKKPIGPVRGAGVPEGCYFVERAVEIMAKKIGLDPIEFRRRNVEAATSSQEDIQSLLDTLVKSANYEGLLRWRDDLKSQNKEDRRSIWTSKPTLVLGLGISLRGEGEEEEEDDWGNSNDSGEWSSQWRKEEGEGSAPWQDKGGNSQEASKWEGSGQWKKGEEREEAVWANNSEGEEEEEELSFTSEFAKVSLHKSGDVTVFTGCSPHGQGHETVFAQLASEALGIPFERIRVMWGDTDLIPLGVGTFGSRSAAVGGSAVVEASRKLKADLLQKAAKTLGKDPNVLDIRNGNIIEVNAPLDVLANTNSVLEKAGLKEISAESKFNLGGTAYSSGVHLCALTLDPETGIVKVEKYMVAEDCGRIINKAIVDGQIQGGVVHGIGGALLEKLAYDHNGNLLTTSFLDYSIPLSTDSPSIEVYHMTTPSQISLNRAKGVGESGTNGSYAAIMNALNDAISQLNGEQVNIAPAFPESVKSSLQKLA